LHWVLLSQHQSPCLRTVISGGQITTGRPWPKSIYFFPSAPLPLALACQTLLPVPPWFAFLLYPGNRVAAFEPMARALVFSALSAFSNSGLWYCHYFSSPTAVVFFGATGSSGVLDFKMASCLLTGLECFQKLFVLPSR